MSMPTPQIRHYNKLFVLIYSMKVCGTMSRDFIGCLSIDPGIVPHILIIQFGLLTHSDCIYLIMLLFLIYGY